MAASRIAEAVKAEAKAPAPLPEYLKEHNKTVVLVTFSAVEDGTATLVQKDKESSNWLFPEAPPGPGCRAVSTRSLHAPFGR